MAFEHTTKAFDDDLQELTRLVAEMGGLAERQIVESVDALIRRDAVLGARVVATDAEIDQLQRMIEERAVLTIAKRQPMAVDLREIVGALRVATDLERIGDLSKNIGKRVNALDSDFHPLKLIRGLEHMTDLVNTQVKAVLDAYAAHDLPAAMSVWKGDEEIDAITRMNALGAQNFNSGIRAYYFSVATVAWFVSEWLPIATCVATILILAHREFFSSSHRTAASAAIIAARRQQERKL